MLKLRGTVRSRFVAVAALSLLMASGLTACKADSNYFTVANASVGSGDGASADATAGFRIRIKQKTGVDAFLHKFGNIADNCEIPLSTGGSPTSIRCMLNMMEYDMWFYGFEYEVSVPINYCTYLYETPYRYYKGEAGNGPSTADITVVDGFITACNLDGVAGTIPANKLTCSNAEATFNPSGAVSGCAYDYTKIGDVQAGPNCCGGYVDVTLTTTTNGVTSSATNKVGFGGKIGNCLESPNDYISDWAKDSSSLAADLVTALGSGSLVKSVKIPSPMTLNGSRRHTHSNFLDAGFHGWAEYASNASTWASTVTVPRAIQPIFDKGRAGTHSGIGATSMRRYSDNHDDGSMTFDCLGPAGELKQRIQVYANAWNTIEDYTTFKKDGNPAAVTPNRVGLSGVDCSAINGTNSCNTVWGWDDLVYDSTLSSVPSSGSTLLLSGGGSAATYAFPYEFVRPDPP